MKFGIASALLIVQIFLPRISAAELPDRDQSPAVKVVDVTGFGVVGDGVADDTKNLQTALDHCSSHEARCLIPHGLKLRITQPVFIWGNSDLVGDETAEIHIDIENLLDRYVLNLGLRRKLESAKAFSGRVENLTFLVINGPRDKWDGKRRPISGRLVQFWNARDAIITNNTFDIGGYFYAATSGQNNRHWLKGLGKRENIQISNNVIRAKAGSHGMEGIGINYASKVDIINNRISGVGDDLIGVHFCDQVTISGNEAGGVDGRIFLANSTDVVVESNKLFREPSMLDNKFRRGVSLIYVGYEYPARVRKPAPENIVIKNNKLEYPDGAIDGGAAINIRGASSVLVKDNVIENESSKVTAHGIWIAPWEDPANVDKAKSDPVYPIKNVSIEDNIMSGAYPLKIVQTGGCDGFKGAIEIKNNASKLRRKVCN